VRPESLEGCDLVCVGAPTEAFSASKPIKDFLPRLASAGLAGKWAFAFDTKLDSRISGSAAKLIEKVLGRLGLRIITPRECAIPFSPLAKDRASVTKLMNGEEKRFQAVGKTVGTALLASAIPVAA
jgi:flavorubredoxin